MLGHEGVRVEFVAIRYELRGLEPVGEDLSVSHPVQPRVLDHVHPMSAGTEGALPVELGGPTSDPGHRAAAVLAWVAAGLP